MHWDKMTFILICKGYVFFYLIEHKFGTFSKTGNGYFLPEVFQEVDSKRTFY